MKRLVFAALAKAALGLSFVTAIALVTALATNWAPIGLILLVVGAITMICWAAGDIMVALFLDWRRTRKGWSSSHWK